MLPFRLPTTFFHIALLALVPACSSAAATDDGSFISWDDLTASSPSIVVAADGTGDVTTVQEAIDKVPANNKATFKILVMPGVYREKVTLDSTKTHVSLIGTDSSTTILSWNLTAGDQPGRTYGSATMTVKAVFFCDCNITFKNTAPSPQPGEAMKQAVALLLAAEKVVIYRCRVLGFQDTLFDNQGVHLFYQSYIRGTIDFLCGSATSLYKECTLESVATSYGAFTASQRSGPDDSGFLFVDCELTGSGQVYLGRAWGAYARVIYAGCTFSSVVIPQGWATMKASDPTSNVFFAEFNCTGPGSDLSHRVPWMHKMTEQEMKPFRDYQFIHGDDWLKLWQGWTRGDEGDRKDPE